MSCIERNSTMVKCFMVIMSLMLACPVSKAELPPSIARLPLFERAVAVVRHFEGWHGPRHHPYVGYGHRLRPGERYSHRMTKRQAEALLRKDLMERCAVFRRFGKDSVLLAVLSYNVGVYRLLGGGGLKKSRLVRKLEAGDRDIYREYVSFRMYRGKVLKGLETRRKVEFALLFVP